MANEITKTSDNIEDLLDKVSGLIEQARTYVKTSVNTAEVYTKYYIGKYIVEYEQEGNQWLANSKDSDNKMFKLSWSHASAYQLYLPDKALLQAKVREWIAEFEENNIDE